ncbi:killer suppression protein HigA [bacterium]|nr:killer suppression protein HigA [bacterium]
MEVYFKTKKMAKIFSKMEELKKRYGFKMAGKIIKRLDDMKAAENLEVLFTLPGNHHPLKGDKKGQFACYLEHPYRLVYEPGNEPLPINENNELIYSKITIVNIIKIEDYH